MFVFFAQQQLEYLFKSVLGSIIAFLVAGFLADHVFNPLLKAGGLLAGTAGSIIGVGEGRGIALMFVISGAMISVISLFIWQNKKMALVLKYSYII